MARRRKLSDAQELALVAEYKGGATLTALAQRHDVPIETIRKMLIRRGVQRRPPGGHPPLNFSAEQIEAMADRWRSGESQAAIGKSLGLRQSQVSKLLRTSSLGPEKRYARGERHGLWRGDRA